MVRVALARVFRDENDELVHARLTAINVSETDLVMSE
jgi:hypothetical protein